MARTFSCALSLVAFAVLLHAGEPASKSKAKSLFDGKTLTNWMSTNFGGEGEVNVENGSIVMDMGSDMTGITYTKNDFPKMNYEVVIEAKKLKGNDFFCTTTFPVGKEFCSLVVGGWGGSVVGLSSLNMKDASENETTKNEIFDNEKWYKVKIRVTEGNISAWIDGKKLVDANTNGKKIGIRPECDPCKPFGICTWRTTAAVRSITVEPLNVKK